MIHTVLTKCQTNHIYLKSLYTIKIDAIIQMRPFSGSTKTFQFTMQSFSLLQFVQKLWLLHNLFWHDFNLYISFNYFSTSGWQFGPVWFWIFWKFKWLACQMMNNLSVRQINWLWWWCNWFGIVRVNLHANSVGRFRRNAAQFRISQSSRYCYNVQWASFSNENFTKTSIPYTIVQPDEHIQRYLLTNWQLDGKKWRILNNREKKNSVQKVPVVCDAMRYVMLHKNDINMN